MVVQMVQSTEHKNLKYYFPGLSIMKRFLHGEAPGLAGTINKNAEVLTRSMIVFLWAGLAQAKNRPKLYPLAHSCSKERSSGQYNERLAPEHLLCARHWPTGPTDVFPQLVHTAPLSDPHISPLRSLLFPFFRWGNLASETSVTYLWSNDW